MRAEGASQDVAPHVSKHPFVERFEDETYRASVGATARDALEVGGMRGRPERQHEQEGRLRATAGERPGRRQRGSVGPVQIVEREQQWAVARQGLDLLD